MTAKPDPLVEQAKKQADAAPAPTERQRQRISDLLRPARREEAS
jgi:hypothetical protein